MRSLGVIHGIIVILGILIFSGLNLEWIFGGAILFLFIFDVLVFCNVITGKPKFIDKLIEWIDEKNTK